MRAKIEHDGIAVTLAYDHHFDPAVCIIRRFIAGHGHVLEDSGSRGWQQVCFGLSSMGNTLTCRDGNHLLPLIRREYRAMRRAEARAERY
jgi:hypothetical protein